MNPWTHIWGQVANINHPQEPRIDKLDKASITGTTNIPKDLPAISMSYLPSQTCSGHQHSNRFEVKDQGAAINRIAIQLLVLNEFIHGKVTTNKRVLNVQPVEGRMIHRNIRWQTNNSSAQGKKSFGCGFGNRNHQTKIQ